MLKFANFKYLAPLSLLLVVGVADAQRLSDLLELARQSEPTYQSAKTNVQAAQARTKQAVGGLLPQISANGSTNGNQRDYQTRNGIVPYQKDTYNSNAYQVSVTQPIWRYANIESWRQAKHVVKQAESQLLGSEQELLAKLVVVWFDVLNARDAILLANKQLEALTRQWEVIKHGAELGAFGRPQVDEAKAKMYQAMADVVTAQTDYEAKLAALEQVVGPLRQLDPPYMRAEVELANLAGDKLELWLERVEQNNPNILAAMSAFEAASAEVRKQYAGHSPTLDAVSSYGKNSQQIGGFPGQAGYDIKLWSIGLQLNIPIFSGGTQSGKVDEAIAMKEKARNDIEAARRAAIAGAKQAWFGWRAAFSRTQAGIQGIKSARSAIAVAEIGTGEGLKTKLEVLQAEQQLRSSQRDFRKGRYDQVVSYVKLKAAAGVLTGEDVMALDALLVKSPVDAEPEIRGNVVNAIDVTVSRRE